MSIWNTLAGAFFGSLLASGIVGWLTQRWIERRERRKKRDDLRLDLYLDVVDLILNNEIAIAERGAEGQIAPVELQAKRLRISHRLKLLGSASVRQAYKDYSRLVFQETAHPVEHRPPNPDEVVHARDILIEEMASDLQEGLNESNVVGMMNSCRSWWGRLTKRRT